MTTALSSAIAVQKPTRVRYGVLGLACSLSMITYLDRVCFGGVADYIKDEFGLSDADKGLMFTAFALAYGAFEVPSGWLGDIFGPRKTLIRIVLWWSAFTALTGLIWPIAGWPLLGFWTLVAVRFCFGIGEAGAYPNIARAFHSWFPFGERGFAKGAVWMAGRFMGGVTPLMVNGLVLFFTSLADDGTTTPHWRPIFWCFGVLGIAWCVIFWWWFRDRPEQNPGVNDAELALIRGGKKVKAENSAAITANPALIDTRKGTATTTGVPWLRLLTSGNLWLLCLAYACSSYGWYFNITYLPGYLREVYGISKGTEFWSWQFWLTSLAEGAPLLCGSVACIFGGLLTDAFIRRTGNRKWGRRIFGMVGKGVCGLCFFAAMYAPNVYTFILAISMASFCNDMAMGAAWASCLDIGRKYSGIVAGCMNMVGNFVGGGLAGYLTGKVLTLLPNDRPLAWQINFASYGVVLCSAVFMWLFFDSTKPLVDED